MCPNWETKKGWVTHFDILGFKSKIEENSLSVEILKDSISHILSELNEDTDVFEGIECIFYADTFLIYSNSDRIKYFHGLLRTSKNFIKRCISSRLAVRGAIAFGELIFGHHKKIILGEAFLESYEYGEDQNWLGLILTPSATKELSKNDLHPNRNEFVNQGIPMRKKIPNSKNEIYAYDFGASKTNYECNMLPILEEMKRYAPKKQKIKYSNTIEFIQRHSLFHKR